MLYQLEPYKGGSTRHQCPQCGTHKSFVRYIDEAGNYLAENVGRCNRESSCGYHYTPKQYFADNPTDRERTPIKRSSNVQPQPQPQVDYIPKEWVHKFFSSNNTFVAFLLCYYSEGAIRAAMQRYALGSTKNLEVIYWQIDQQRNARTGKIMAYDETGHRTSNVNWVHSMMKRKGLLREDFHLQQCLFGEHLLSLDENKDKPIALVESEKSAVICSIEFPQYIWLATGGKSQLNARAEAIKGRKVVAFPDADAVEEWQEATKKYPFISLSDLFDDMRAEERASGLDIADIIIIDKEIKKHGTDKESAWQSVAELFLFNAESEKAAARASYIHRRWENYWMQTENPTRETADDILAALCEKNPHFTTLVDKLKLKVVSWR